MALNAGARLGPYEILGLLGAGGMGDDIGTHDGRPYVVTELLKGETLRERLRGGRLPFRKATEYGVQITQGLSAAHEKGIVHRDLKPESLFVTRDGLVTILGFGLSKVARSVTPSEGSEDTSETAGFVGHARYRHLNPP